MCKTNFSVVIFYDGTRSAKEVLNNVIASKVRRKIDNDIEILEGKEYNQGSTQEKYPRSITAIWYVSIFSRNRD